MITVKKKKKSSSLSYSITKYNTLKNEKKSGRLGYVNSITRST